MVLSFLFGIYIFCPSSSSYAKLTCFILAVSFNPPALSIASDILLPDGNSITPSFFTSPVIYTIIVSSSLSSSISSTMFETVDILLFPD